MWCRNKRFGQADTAIEINCWNKRVGLADIKSKNSDMIWP